MYPRILSPEQEQLLPLIKLFRREFFLVGGTAIALQTGHRRSIDFDLFRRASLHTKKVIDKIRAKNYRFIITRNVSEQLNLTISSVKMTFFEYPYPIEAAVDFNGVIRMPDLLTLASMKAFALGRRSKWKDYVDLYFLLRDHFSLNEIIQRAERIFEDEFSAKLFRSQLAYHGDIDYTEEVDYIQGYYVEPDEIRKFLIDITLNW
jgi:hypothetical protein